MMNNIVSVSTEKSWYCHIWPWLLMLGPVVVILAGGYTSWLAFTRQDAMVVGDYYKQGKAINQDLRRDHHATKLGMQSVLRYDAAAGQLTGAVNRRGKPYSGKIQIRLVHSTLPEKDMQLEIQLDSNGKFTAEVPMLEIAHWQIVIENADRDWRLHGDWAWPQQKEIRIVAETPPVD